MGKKPMHPLIDAERQGLAKCYFKDNLAVNIASYTIFVLLALAFLMSGLSAGLVEWLGGFSPSRFLVILFYFAILYLGYSIITLPFVYIDGYRIEHKYHFSTQTLTAWFVDWIKSLLVNFVIGAVVFEIIYLVTRQSQNLWWLWLSLIMILFNVVLANLFPVLILPLFYKTTPIENDSLKNRIAEIGRKVRINIRGIFSINLSSKTTKANAAVVGLGNTKRILLGDTLLNQYHEDETLAALAHEITHYQEHHIWWLNLWESLITMTMFYIFHLIYPYIYGWAGFTSIDELGAFPLFALIFIALSFIFKPIISSLSRYYERRADRGALELTSDAESFINLMAKSCNRQLMIAYPNRFVEWFNYSHPSAGNRIQFAEIWIRQKA